MAPENIDDIFARTLVGDYDDESPWEAVRALRQLGSRDVFDHAAEWCRADDPLKRARGADVLAQLGRTLDNPTNNFQDECFLVVSALAQVETNPLPLLASVHALGHFGNPRAVPLVAAHHLDQDVDVRFAVACALANFADHPSAAHTLRVLMRDVDEDVRDWATFALGVLSDLDSEEIRDALVERLADPSRDVREEALVGLARRQDRRALELLIAELDAVNVSGRVLEAAEEFLDEKGPEHSPSDYVALLKIRFHLK